MQIAKCANCSKKILIQGINVIACKCRELFFCSTSCYKVAIKAHKKICPFFTSKQQTQPVFSSPLITHTQAPLPLPSLKRHDRVPAELCSIIRDDSDDGSRSHTNTSQSRQIPVTVTREQTQNPRTKPSSQNPQTHPSSQNRQTCTDPSSQNPLTNHSSQNLQTSSQIFSDNQSSPPSPSAHNSRDHSSLPGSHISRKRKRETSGVFAKENNQIQTKDPLTEEQKRKNAVASRVSKHKDAIVKHCRQIKILRPDVSLLVTLESTKKNCLAKPVVFKSTGQSVLGVPTPSPPTENNTTFDLTEVEDTNLEPVPAEDRSAQSKQVRVCDLRCKICKAALGTNNSTRLVCTTKNCYRAPVHLACLDLWPNSERMLRQIRCIYRCPAHSRTEQTLAEDTEGGEDEEEDASRFGIIQDFVKAKKSRTKNDNFLRPKKVSHLVQEVLDTKQKFLPSNDLRALLRGYVTKRNLKYERGTVYPDKKLAQLTGSEPFKLVTIVTVLKKNKHLE